MQVDGSPVEFLENCVAVQSGRDLVSGLRVLAHDEKQRLPATLQPFVTALQPALITELEVHLEFVRRVVGGLLHQVPGPTNDRCLDDSRIHRLAQRRVADDMLEEVGLVVFRRGGEIELRNESPARPLSNALVEELDGLIPG